MSLAADADNTENDMEGEQRQKRAPLEKAPKAEALKECDMAIDAAVADGLLSDEQAGAAKKLLEHGTTKVMNSIYSRIEKLRVTSTA